MVQINFAQKTVNVKVVYYGPGMSGKTTNLEVVHQRAPDTNRGDLTSISTDGDRTLFFDYMPLDLGTVAGMRTCFQIYTVPGQVYYNSTRKLVLQGVDGVLFIADSAASMLDQNIESLRNLEENLNEYGKTLESLPHVLQWNKRDLPDAMSTEELGRHLNVYGAPTFEAVANSGQGVFPTLKALAALVLKNIMKETGGAGTAPAAASPTAGGAASAATVGGSHPAPAPAVSATPHARGQAAEQTAPKTALELKATEVAASVPSQNSPAQLMASAPVQQHSPTVQHRAKAGPAKSSTARHATPGGTALPKRRVSPPKKKSGTLTGVFVVVAAGVGAALAWFLLSLL